MRISDYSVENHGSLFLIRANSTSAYQHLSEHVSDEAQWLGTALAVEPRYIVNLVEGLRAEGYEVD